MNFTELTWGIVFSITYDCIINLKVELSNIVLFHEVADYLFMEGCSILRNAEILKVYTVCKI